MNRHQEFLIREYKSPKVGPNYQLYGIVCNNTVNGGDCYGTTMCLCKLSNEELQRYYLTTRKDTPIRHTDYDCDECDLRICQCCYNRCPHCRL